MIVLYSSQEETSEDSPDSEDYKRKATEVNRMQKWVKMIAQWDKYKNSEKVRTLIALWMGTCTVHCRTLII